MPTNLSGIASPPGFRSGAVARLAHMPVSTLRIWEQRYHAVGPMTAPSGHRLYSKADVERVRLLRRLTGQGHAIGTLAGLSATQLQALVDSQATADAPSPDAQSAPRTARLRLAVVGRAMALRLQRPGVLQRLARSWCVTAVFDSLDAAVRATGNDPVDLLLWQSPGLQAGTLAELQAVQDACRAGHVAVAYRYAGAAARTAFAGTGATLIREPADDEALADRLASLEERLAAGAAAPAAAPRPHALPGPTPGDVAPRRFDDATLTTFADLSTNVACECPRHVAELLLQLASFETYSADCLERSSPADAELHAYLLQVASVSRTLLESALERLARHEGLALP